MDHDGPGPIQVSDVVQHDALCKNSMMLQRVTNVLQRPRLLGRIVLAFGQEVADPDIAAPVANGAVGVIEVKGPNVFKGYWRDP